MSGDPYRKALPGEKLRIPAVAWNRVLDMVAPSSGTAAGEEFSYRQANLRLYCQNSTGTGVDRWDVLAITGVTPTPSGVTGAAAEQFQRSPAVVGVATTAETGGAFVVAVEPIRAGELGLVAVAGVVQARVQMRCTGHQYAKPKANEIGYMQSADSGPFRIMWVGATGPIPTGTTGPGTPWALLLFGTERTSESITSHTTGAVQLLGHGKAATGASGCDTGLQWYTVTECSGTPSYASSYFL